jgi:hypothetical protein
MEGVCKLFLLYVLLDGVGLYVPVVFANKCYVSVKVSH